MNPRPSATAPPGAAEPAPNSAAAHRAAGRWRAATLLFAGLWLVTATWAARELRWLDRYLPAEPEVGALPLRPATAPDPVAVWRRSTFDRLPGWRDDDVLAALPALARSCAAFRARPAAVPTLPEAATAVGATADRDAWLGACVALDAAPPGDAAALRVAIEGAFTPWSLVDGAQPLGHRGLLTGYYEPLLHGSRRRGGPFRTPLLAAPRDVVSVDLGRFRAELAGKKIAGRLVGSTLEPYFDRAAIDGGALAGRGLELVWVDDAVDAFFLHIQGSGRVALDDGSVLRLGYAAQNGHPYVAIGKLLVERGELVRSAVSMGAIRDWLAAHPGEAGAVLAANPSYVFFRELGDRNAVGSLGVELVAGRSLAVDRRNLPLGAPVWLDALAPAAADGAPDVALQRLVVAQDTGGAIRGVVRGDLFWGFGDEATSRAGRMRHPVRMWVLLPRTSA